MVHQVRWLLCIGPGPLNITFGSDMPITLLHLMLMSKIYVVNSDMKNVIGMSDTNVMFKGPGSGYPMMIFSANEIRTCFEMIPITVSFVFYENVLFFSHKVHSSEKRGLRSTF